MTVTTIPSTTGVETGLTRNNRRARLAVSLLLLTNGAVGTPAAALLPGALIAMLGTPR